MRFPVSISVPTQAAARTGLGAAHVTVAASRLQSRVEGGQLRQDMNGGPVQQVAGVAAAAGDTARLGAGFVLVQADGFRQTTLRLARRSILPIAVGTAVADITAGVAAKDTRRVTSTAGSFVGGIMGGAVAGLIAGSLIGAPTGPGALVSGALGGIVGAIAGERVANELLGKIVGKLIGAPEAQGK